MRAMVGASVPVPRALLYDERYLKIGKPHIIPPKGGEFVRAGRKCRNRDIIVLRPDRAHAGNIAEVDADTNRDCLSIDNGLGVVIGHAADWISLHSLAVAAVMRLSDRRDGERLVGSHRDLLPCSTQVEMSAFSITLRYCRGHGDSDHELRGAGPREHSPASD